MITKVLMSLTLCFVASAAAAQTQNSTTNCYSMGYSVQCNTATTTPSQGLNVDWSVFKPVDIGEKFRQGYEQGQRMRQQAEERRLIAERRQALAAQRIQLQQATDQAAAQVNAEQATQKAEQDKINNAMDAAIARDNGSLPPPPAEPPVRLACTIGDRPINLTMYEKSGRVDETHLGETKARAGQFTPDTVSWAGSVWRSAVSRTDLTLNMIAIIPELHNAQLSGTCVIAERKF